MDNTTIIKEQIDSLYSEYQKNKSQLNAAKTKEVAKHLAALSNSNNEMKYIAEQLSKFSADVVRSYFDAITKINGLPISLLDDVLIEFQKSDSNPKSSQYFVQKYVSAITVIMKNSGEKALTSTQLAKMVTFIARYAVKSDKNKTKFQNLVNETSGGIYMLDYSKGNHNSLLNIWNVTKAIFPDFSKAKYSALINDWAIKYGFIRNSSSENDNPIQENNASAPAGIGVSKKLDTKPADIKEEKTVQNETVTETVKTKKNELSDLDIAAKKIYNSLSRDIKVEQETILTKLSELILPISKSLESISGEVDKSREIARENMLLKSKMAEFEKQLTEQKIINNEAQQAVQRMQSELTESKARIQVLESQNSELDAKLVNAYSINSREASLEAERIRSELKKAFTFLYEDWLEYEFSDVTEENYESLQAIIKKVFRSLERNGIDFKGNN